TRNLDEDEKLVQKFFVAGQNRDVITINESGLYALIMRSNKPEAKKFRKWVTSEVLPEIRRTGLSGRPR
ncbi:MAG: Bro-N domain-containing protein, partial [Synergistaceae bacterium]|nr:Bro-N domain-containing protein [Synergistaceae bacterium]